MSLNSEFENLTVEAVRQMVAEQRQEDLHLDFKTAGADLDREDRKNLAKAISGFANSDGGLIVWGVDCRPDEEGIDCARLLAPIAPIDRFLARLTDLAAQASSPIVEGVLHRVLPNGDGSGFAVTFVPVSDSGPHQAKLGEDRYYKRNGASFRKMEHFDLEDMFGRRKKPVLTLTTQVIYGTDPAPDGVLWQYSLVLSIANRGRAAARAPMLAFAAVEPWRLRTYGIGVGVSEAGVGRVVRLDGMTAYAGPTTVAIHIGTERPVCSLACRTEGKEGAPDPLRLPYEIAAENVRLSQGVLELSTEDLVRASRRRAR